MRPTVAAAILALLSSGVPHASSANEDAPRPLDPAEARSIVREQRLHREEKAVERREAALAKPALRERVVDAGGVDLVLRELAPRPRVEPPAPSAAKAAPEFTPEQLAFPVASRETISLGGVSFDGRYSRMHWTDRDTGNRFEIWAEVDLMSLRQVGAAFTSGGIAYDCFFAVEKRSSELEKERAAAARRYGTNHSSRWMVPPRTFSNRPCGYFVVTEADVEVPERLHRQLTALFGHYLQHRKRFDTLERNAQLLREARGRDLELNPPKKPERVILNFTPLRGEAAE